MAASPNALPELLRHVGWAQMRVAEEHLEIPMTADQRHLRYREAKFEESTDRLVAEVMKMEVFDPGPPFEPLPR